MASLAMLLALAMQAAPAAPAADTCHVDGQAMMELGLNAFDQDMDGGWRELAQRPGCRERAADLIRTYRDFVLRRLPILYWHEGQLRAGLGQTEQAVQLFEQARSQDDEHGWNHYVDANIAFLRGDREALAEARERLAALPRPPGWDTRRLPNGQPVVWPMNLDVVDGFVRCFGRSYEEAYGSTECRARAGGQGQ